MHIINGYTPDDIKLGYCQKCGETLHTKLGITRFLCQFCKVDCFTVCPATLISLSIHPTPTFLVQLIARNCFSLGVAGSTTKVSIKLSEIVYQASCWGITNHRQQRDTDNLLDGLPCMIQARDENSWKNIKKACGYVNTCVLCAVFFKFDAMYEA